MSLHARRLLPAVVLAAALLGGASAHAQIGGFLKKKLPKLPVPGASAPAPAVNERPKYCAATTDEILDRFLKALETENAAIAWEEEAKRRVTAAARNAAEMMTMEGMEKFEACFAVPLLAAVSAPVARLPRALALPGVSWHESAPGFERAEFDLPGANGGWPPPRSAPSAAPRERSRPSSPTRR